LGGGELEKFDSADGETNEQDQHEEFDDNGGDSSRSQGEIIDQDPDNGVFTTIQADENSAVHQPDKAIPRQLIGPRQRIIDDIPENDLNECRDDNHQEHDGYNPFTDFHVPVSHRLVNLWGNVRKWKQYESVVHHGLSSPKV
jgi:hypothetical protein